MLNLIASGINAIGKSVSGKKYLKAQREYNQTQRDIAQMNNEFNSREAAINRAWQTNERAIQNEWNLAQWNRENEYNSASAQRKRWEEAGYNPFFMEGNAGTASSVSSAGVGSPAPAQSAGLPHQIPIDPYKDSNNFIDLLSRSFETVGRAFNTVKDIQFGSDKRRADIAGLINGNYEWLSPEYRNQRQNAAPVLAGIDIGTRTQELEGLKIQNQYTASRDLYTRLNAFAQNIVNNYLNAQQRLDLFAKAAQIFVDFTQGKSNLASVSRQMSEYIKNLTDAAGRRIDNRIKEATSDAFIKSMIEEYKSNEAYYKSMKHMSAQMAANDASISNWNRDLIKLQYDAGKLNYDRSLNETWRNKKHYRNALGLWNDLGLGQLAALAAGAGISRIPIKGVTKAAAKKSPFKYKSDFNFHDYYKSKHYWDDYND